MKTLRTLGERKAIELILERLTKMPDMPIPFGDDVSAYPISDDYLAVMKTDMLVGKTDVPPRMNLWQAARKAVVMNISDFAAKGVKPLCMLVSLGLPSELSERDIEAISEGLDAGAREYGVYTIGGDTNEALDLVISLSVFGIAKKGSVVMRSGVKPGDLVAVTGLFGKTAAGLKLLIEGLEAPNEVYDTLVDSVYMPKARLKEGLALSATGAVTASIDSSDGLAWSLYEIARASGVGFVIDNVPLAPEAKIFAEENGLDPFDLVFYGGEEYELVLTINPTLWGRAEEAIKKVGGSLIKIGWAIGDGQVILETPDRRQLIEPRGWEHFRRD